MLTASHSWPAADTNSEVGLLSPLPWNRLLRRRGAEAMSHRRHHLLASGVSASATRASVCVRGYVLVTMLFSCDPLQILSNLEQGLAEDGGVSNMTQENRQGARVQLGECSSSLSQSDRLLRCSCTFAVEHVSADIGPSAGRPLPVHGKA